jgi:hypothetical protein
MILSGELNKAQKHTEVSVEHQYDVGHNAHQGPQSVTNPQQQEKLCHCFLGAT